MWIGLRSQSHLRLGFDSDSRPSSSALPLQAPTGEGAGSGESLSVHNCSCCGYIRFLLFVSLSWSFYDGLKAVTHHAEAKKHKECESAAAMSPRMKSFFTPKSSAQRRFKENDVPFSVATDASNTGNRKYFPLAIQYFSPKSGICHKILDFYEDSFEDSKSIKERLCEVMDKSRLPWSRVTAYGADNASVNFGVNNFVFQKLKSEENNDIIAAHCNDHIFHNCAKNALKVMPVDVENIVMKVFAEFSCSAKKREDLKECFDFFESEYREVIRHVPTRWFSLFNALDRMLSSWGPLKRYFIERGSDNCPTAL
ncbi:uncharacterized protein TNCV_3871891 [Trichonephila clavipes]|nr:uncharacterized protein TNCV_3871891 [Trichonephila clavipes]